jgi:predicted O-methyltransferase YrrM
LHRHLGAALERVCGGSAEMKRWHVLAKLVQSQGWRRGAEIGVFKGATLLHLLKTCPKLHMIGVDPWERTPGGPKDMATGEKDWSGTPMEEYESHVRNEAAAFGDRSLILKMRSIDAARIVEAGSLDFVFVDGDHRTDAVLTDIGVWWRKVRPGGMVLGHDWNWPSVRRAVQHYCPAPALHADNVWAIRC